MVRPLLLVEERGPTTTRTLRPLRVARAGRQGRRPAETTHGAEKAAASRLPAQITRSGATTLQARTRT